MPAEAAKKVNATAARPLFWLELFDHNAQSAIDSCSCYSIEEASTVFELTFDRAVVNSRHGGPIM
jgi:hypothetical protein